MAPEDTSNAEDIWNPYLTYDLCPHELLEVPAYGRLNMALGLSSNCRLFDEVHDEIGRERLYELLTKEIEPKALFLLIHPFFLQNFYFFAVEHLHESLRLGKIVSDVGKENIGSISYLSNLLAALARNRRICTLEDFFDMAQELAGIIVPKCASLKDDRIFPYLLSTISQCRSLDDLCNLYDALEEPNCSLDRLQQNPPYQPPKIKRLGLNILDGCKVGCDFCNITKGADKKNWDLLNLDDVKSLKSIIDESGAVSISGGEPADHPDFIRIFKYLCDCKVPICIVTTGFELDTLQEMLPFLKSHMIERINISVHNKHVEKGKRRCIQTIEFFKQHNIPFILNLRGDADDKDGLQREMERLYSELFFSGLELIGQEWSQVKLAPKSASVYKTLRDPLCIATVSPVLYFDRSDNASKRLDLMMKDVLAMGGKLRDVCLFREDHPSFRPNRTVCGCSSIPNYGIVPPILDHLPQSADEILKAMKRFGEEVKAVLLLAKIRRQHPCLVHRQMVEGKL